MNINNNDSGKFNPLFLGSPTAGSLKQENSINVYNTKTSTKQL
jgi:hypothetical protein